MANAPIPYAIPQDLTQWALDVEAAGGYPASDTPALIAWGNSESPGAAVGSDNSFIDYANVLGTTLPIGSSVGTNSDGVQNYLTGGVSEQQAWEEGLIATIDELNQSNFASIEAALKSGVNQQQLGAVVGATPWGTSGSTIAGASTSGGPAGSGTPGSVNVASGGALSGGSSGSTSAGTTQSTTLPGFGGFLQQFNAVLNPTGASLISSLSSLGTADIAKVAIMLVSRGILTVGFLGATYIGLKTLTGKSDVGGVVNPYVRIINAQANRTRSQAYESDIDLRAKRRQDAIPAKVVNSEPASQTYKAPKADTSGATAAASGATSEAANVLADGLLA